MPVIDEARWNQAHTMDEWMGPLQDEYHQKFIQRVARTVQFRPEDQQFFEALPRTVRLLLISMECGADSEFTGVLSRVMALAGDRLEVRMFQREEVPDLMQRYLKDGKYESVPVLVALDEDWEETGVFWEMAPAHDAWVQESRRQYISGLGFTDGRSLGDLPFEQQQGWIEIYKQHWAAEHQQINQLSIDEIRRLVQSSLDAERVPVRRQGGSA